MSTIALGREYPISLWSVALEAGAIVAYKECVYGERQNQIIHSFGERFFVAFVHTARLGLARQEGPSFKSPPAAVVMGRIAVLSSSYPDE